MHCVQTWTSNGQLYFLSTTCLSTSAIKYIVQFMLTNKYFFKLQICNGSFDIKCAEKNEQLYVHLTN